MRSSFPRSPKPWKRSPIRPSSCSFFPHTGREGTRLSTAPKCLLATPGHLPDAVRSNPSSKWGPPYPRLGGSAWALQHRSVMLLQGGRLGVSLNAPHCGQTMTTSERYTPSTRMARHLGFPHPKIRLPGPVNTGWDPFFSRSMFLVPGLGFLITLRVTRSWANHIAVPLYASLGLNLFQKDRRTKRQKGKGKRFRFQDRVLSR